MKDKPSFQGSVAPNPDSVKKVGPLITMIFVRHRANSIDEGWLGTFDVTQLPDVEDYVWVDGQEWKVVRRRWEFPGVRHACQVLIFLRES